jgi:glycosyltransferase involved in cell wall biosynthesis
VEVTVMNSRIVAIIPALDEEDAIGAVVRGIAGHVDVVIVVDNGSTDRTAAVAASAGADVVAEPRRGYGRACLAGIARARELGASIVVFLDADGSDDPSDAPGVIGPVAAGRADLTLGVRTGARVEPGAMTGVQRFGNWLAPLLIRASVGARYDDMPPFKACSAAALDRLRLSDVGHGFTIELLMRAHEEGLRVEQIPVACRVRRGGESKVSGTLRGASRAAVKIVTTIGRHAARAHGKRASAYLRAKNPWSRAAARRES